MQPFRQNQAILLISIFSCHGTKLAHLVFLHILIELIFQENNFFTLIAPKFYRFIQVFLNVTFLFICKYRFLYIWIILGDVLAMIFSCTRRCGPLRGPSSSSCGGLRPLAEAFFCPWGKKRSFYVCFCTNFGHF